MAKDVVEGEVLSVAGAPVLGKIKHPSKVIGNVYQVFKILQF